MKTKILFVLTLLCGLLFANAGLNKLLNYMPVPEENLSEALIRDMTALMQVRWLWPMVAAAEILGGILLIFPRTRALGALVLFPVMVGVMLFNTMTDSSALLIALVVLAILLWVMYENRKRYICLIANQD